MTSGAQQHGQQQHQQQHQQPEQQHCFQQSNPSAAAAFRCTWAGCRHLALNSSSLGSNIVVTTNLSRAAAV
jgi:hypothetical protein